MKEATTPSIPSTIQFSDLKPLGLYQLVFDNKSDIIPIKFENLKRIALDLEKISIFATIGISIVEFIVGEHNPEILGLSMVLIYLATKSVYSHQIRTMIIESSINSPRSGGESQ